MVTIAGNTQNLDGNELDSSVFFRDEVSELSSVVDLPDALNRFGFDLTDKIERRELVTIYSKIKKAMDAEIFHLANVLGHYTAAKEMKQRQLKIRKEFDDLQLNGVRRNIVEQDELFEKASNRLRENLNILHTEEINRLSDTKEFTKEREDFFHGIETSNLEQTISKMNRPNVRFSKRLIELRKAETGLNNLNQYDDALKVHKMIEKILPKEEKKFYDTYDKSIEMKRTKQKKLQEQQKGHLDEHLKKLEYKEVRKREHDKALLEQRIKNHLKDMKHTHSMESKIKPEMSIKPSAMWERRAGYNSTSSSLRGEQLYNHARGKSEGTLIFAESLTDRHNFLSPPNDTSSYYP